MREGLIPAFVSLPWLMMIAPLLLSYLAPLRSQSTEAPHRTHKSRYKLPTRPKDPTGIYQQPVSASNWTQATGYYLWISTTKLGNKCSAITTNAMQLCWKHLQNYVFGMRTRHHRRHCTMGARKSHSATYYVPRSQKRGSRVGRKRRTAQHWKWSKLLFLATLAQGQPTAFASGLSTTRPPPSNTRRFAAFDSDSVTLRVDNCCTACITNSLADVVGTPVPIAARIEGFTGGEALVTAKCTVKWQIEDDHGRAHTIVIPNSLYSKNAPFRLLSPQHWAQQANDHQPKREGTWCGTLSDRVELEWQQRKYKRTILLDPATNVALFHTAPNYDKFETFCSVLQNPNDDPVAYAIHPVSDDEASDDEDPEGDDTDDASSTEGALDRQHPVVTDFNLQGLQDGATSPAIVEDEEDRLEDSQSELLHWHHKLGHSSFHKLRLMAAKGDISKRLTTCKVPMCTACLFGKATKRPWRTKAAPNKIKIRTITKPGDCVSVDQIESTTPGLVGQMKGYLTTKRYRCATVFVDHFSGLSYVHVQKSTTADETLQGKRQFEAYCATYGVRVQHYHADNGRFAENLFVNDITVCGQTISYCGVNAHFQNGVAEKRIRDLQDLARTMMIHARHRWPQAIAANLWPYALKMANDVHMSTPTLKQEGAPSPLEKFSGIAVLPKISSFHPFGCPVYVLDSAIASGKSLPKWEERARVGIYLGASPRHSRSVAMVLSLTTGLVSMQYHVVFDDHFQTIRNGRPGSLSYKSDWQSLAGLNLDLDEQPKPSKGKGKRSGRAARVVAQLIDPILPGQEREEAHQDMQTSEGAEVHPSEGVDEVPVSQPPSDPVDPDPGEDDNDEVMADPRQGQEHGPRPRHSGRQRRPPTWWEPYFVANETLLTDDTWDAQQVSIDKGTIDPIAFVASNDPDVMYYDQAMKQPDADKFSKACDDEIAAHHENGHWKVVERTQIPRGTKVVPSVWSMKRKRRIDTREVYKWKARLNVHGGKQEYGVHYWETYAPVVQWTSIRLCLILSVLQNWHTRQLDFVLAYPQADVETEQYMEMPKGFNVGGKSRASHVLKLLKNIYGGKAASRIWVEHLKKGLIDMGFTQSTADPCVFYRGQLIFLHFVDDCICLSPVAADVDKFLADLRAANFNVTDEGQISDYLGVKVEKLPDGRIKLSQPHLIDQILEDLGLNLPNTVAKPSPALSSKIIGRDLEGKPFNEKWEYRSVIGKLNFLEKSTRLDLGYATHQCARFCTAPKESHAIAVKRIGRYLKGTRDQGLILKPEDYSFEVFVDADHSGNWKFGETEDDMATAKSRTGYVIKYAGCPVVWHSKLQTEIALSSTEAEYVSLSESLRDTIPMMQLIKEIQDRGFEVPTSTPVIHCRLFEDNSGALELARVPKMRSRTKHMNLKYHHFRDFVARGLVTVHPINTREQPADVLTKPLGDEDFQRHRLTLLGW
jgi:hypothetical protein